jgi:bis(5'-nucleosyl)-tetraphosphatase (symmetrical)
MTFPVQDTEFSGKGHSIPDGAMRWFVGDIHGCRGAFERLLERIRFDPARDELWSVGDLVNTGTDSAEVLRLWIETGAQGVMGNHDAHALRVLAGTRALREEDTLQELLQSTDVEPLMSAMRSLPLLVHLPGGDTVRDVWLVHAGLHPGWSDLHAVADRINAGPHDESWLLGPELRFATRARCCAPSGEMLDLPGPPEDCVAPYRPWDSYYGGEALVVHGHWAQRGYYRSERTLGLDSGCVYGGPLTAWCQEEDRIVQVSHP